MSVAAVAHFSAARRRRDSRAAWSLRRPQRHVRDIEQRGLFAAELVDSTFVWRSVQTTDLNMFEIGDGYIPDLIVMDAEILTEARTTKAKHQRPTARPKAESRHQVERIRAREYS